MSVPVGLRNTTKLKIFLDCQKLSSYTVQITSNENNFSKKYDYFIKKIQDKSIEIYYNSFSANEIKVNTKQDFEKRIGLQKQAIQDCKDLYILVDIAVLIFHIDSKRVENWCGLIDNVKMQLINWNKYDIESRKDFL